MKRTAVMALVGAALMLPIEADAQRQRARQAPPPQRVDAPISGRLTHCRAPARAASYRCGPAAERRVVYRYSGDRFRTRRPMWRTARWERTTFRFPRRLHRNRGRILDQRDLRDLLGQRAVRRLSDHGRDLGLRGPLRGHWMSTPRTGSVLTVTVRGQDVAELYDFDRDGLVDDVLLRDVRRQRRTAWAW